jgi:hypothetical protein
MGPGIAGAPNSVEGLIWLFSPAFGHKPLLAAVPAAMMLAPCTLTPDLAHEQWDFGGREISSQSAGSGPCWTLAPQQNNRNQRVVGYFELP